MVSPDDLLALSRRLLAEGSEIADRSAVSRAYYAAFWHCRALSEQRIGPIETVGADVHREVSDAVGQIDRQAGIALLDLRQWRNSADYQPARTFGRERAELAVALAEGLLTLE